MSGPTISPHIVVAGTRRSWTREEKRAILDEAQSTTASVSSVARRHGLTPSLLFRWRRESWDEERAASLPVQPAFVPFALPAPPRLPTCDQGLPGCAIEVELADGRRLGAEAGADPALVRDLLAALLDRGSPLPRARACGWPPVTRT
jgi:transposase